MPRWRPSSRGLVLLLTSGLVLLWSIAGPVQTSTTAPPSLILSIGKTPLGPPIPADFLGLSYEVKDLALVASLADKGTYVLLLRSLGPGVLRFGGVTADSQVAWLDRRQHRCRLGQPRH